ncbi:MAG TPA: DEAD/DEAH box helicase family protein [Phycisphaerae bacterium]|nr:DEAD/DEAH box helicase family protein [Phycisphaerae bacterium]
MPKQVVIENPIINSPFEEPERHFRFDDEGITSDIVPERRVSCYFVPIAQPRKKGKTKQLAFETEWTRDRIEENKTVNAIRRQVQVWREGRYTADVTRMTARLLEYWRSPERSRRLFFCQIEALETLIYLAEVAGRRYGDDWIHNDLRRANEDANPGLLRIASKMATGSGKTVVMAMLIAWQTLNKIADPRGHLFTDSFLVVTPGITIRDRLRVLLPSDPGNYYRAMEIVPPDLMDQMQQAKVLITNFHALKPREKVKAGRLTKDLLAGGERKGNASAFTESEGEMVRRVCRGLGTKKNVIVINDEAHHCYRRRAGGADERLTGDERKEAERRDEAARVWISGLEAVQRKLGIKAVYDLSATPFFLRGSGYPEGTLFPWVVSDFSLIDAIESGIVKVPRVPVADDAMQGDQPTYRNIWLRIREDLPKKGRRTQAVTGEPNLPAVLEGALQSLYANYAKYFERWEENEEARANGLTPPVFIVVCNNTNVSKLVFDYIAGWEKTLPDGTAVAVPGKLPLFSNVDGGRFLLRPNTVLVDSEQLESGEAMSNEFKKAAAMEIEEFKAEYRQRFPDRDVEKLTDEDLLREVMNTVGKTGKLGEHIRCVVSVSMLTEGWDANTVTHILGIRAFGTQLLCEQVVGRGLRRMGYSASRQTFTAPDGETAEFDGFPVQYAEVYGVPFSFIPCSGSTTDPKPGPIPTRVRALEDRIACEISFPRIDGYRYDLPAERLAAKFTDDSHLALTTQHVPTKVENAPIVGESVIHTLDDLKARREQEVAFLIAREIHDHYFRDDQQNPKPWLFPDLVAIVRQWMRECLTLKVNTFPQLLLLAENAHDACDRIYRAIVAADSGAKRLLPIPKPYDTVGSTRFVDFDTTRPTYKTDPKKCHISHVVADTESWEQKMAQTLEDMPEVIAYVKNHNLGFLIPYTLNGDQRHYMPDFIVHLDDGREDPLNLLVEVTGERDKDKAAKVATARDLWIPAVNNAGTWGRWAFIEIADPWDAKNLLSGILKQPGSAEGPGRTLSKGV